MRGQQTRRGKGNALACGFEAATGDIIVMFDADGSALVIHAGKVLTHKHLLREVWRDESVDPQYLRVYVRQLRQKVEDDPSTPRHVLTEPGVGYRLV